MPQTITYYALIDDESTRDRPAGILRRLVDPDGSFVDEGLRRDLGWRRTSIIVEWERAEATDDLVEIPEDEANRIIERFRARWAAEG